MVDAKAPGETDVLDDETRSLAAALLVLPPSELAVLDELPKSVLAVGDPEQPSVNTPVSAPMLTSDAFTNCLLSMRSLPQAGILAGAV